MASDSKPKTSTKNPASAKATAPAALATEPARNLTEAKLRVMAEVQYIRKRGTMSGGGSYKFVRDTDVIAALRGPMIVHGLALAGPVEIRNRTRGTVTTAGGKAMAATDAEFCFQLKHAVTGETENVWVIGEAQDHGDKSSNKAMAAARKYALLLGFNLTTGDDPDQFDEEGRYGGGDDVENEHEHGKADHGRAEPQPPAQSKPTTVPASNGKPKTEEPKPAVSTLPASGAELAKRLGEYDAKLAANNIGTPGALLAFVTAAGVKAGYPAKLDEWTGPAIAFAVDTVKVYETESRKPVSQPVTNKDEPKAEAKAAELAAEQKADAEANWKAQEQAAKSAATQPAPAATPGPEERFTKRIAGMNSSTTKENLDKFRERYTKDGDMTATQKADLETCYWHNVKRVSAKK